MATTRGNRRQPGLRQRHAGTYGVPSRRGPVSLRSVMLLLLCGGPVLLICTSFLFGVGLQSLGLVGTARHGGILGGLGGLALTVLVGAFFCVPGYFIAVVWFGFKSRISADDLGALKKQLMGIPLVSLVMFWLPAVLVPQTNLGVRVQIAGLTVILMLLFGYLWIAIIRLLIRSFIKMGVVQYS